MGGGERASRRQDRAVARVVAEGGADRGEDAVAGADREVDRLAGVAPEVRRDERHRRADRLEVIVEGELRRGSPHPRNFGTFPRVLGVYVRERKVLTLEDAIRKMTSLNANKLGLKDRGLVRNGQAADICIFDAAKVLDHATYSDPFQYNDGIEYVIVNGKVVLKQGQHTGMKPGKVLRHNVK